MADEKVFGFDRLLQQTLVFVSENFQGRREDAPGDSEIEKLFVLALILLSQVGATEYQDLIVVTSEEDELAWLEIDNRAPIRIVVRPQVTIGKRRVDFLIHALDWSGGFAKKDQWKWRKLIIECDGHDFHERTKKQAASDRAKDRAAVLQGVDCFRFTGSELWNNPWACAEQVTDWAIKGWYWPRAPRPEKPTAEN